MKEIWNDFIFKIKEEAINAWEGLKQICSSSFKILKDAVIGLVIGIYEWLIAVITGIGKIILALINFIFSALGVALFSSLKYLVDLVISWIKKW